MRIEQVRHAKQGSDSPSTVRLQPGQIVRGKILQIFPLNRAQIQLGSFQFVAQLEAPVEHGERYFFQVADVADDIHLRVIQQPHIHEQNEWKHILQYIGSKHSKVREQFIQELLQSNIPFTKKALLQVFTLLDNHPQQLKAMQALKLIMQREWPLTKEVMESLIAYHSSTFTKEVDTLYQSLSKQNQKSHSNTRLIGQLEYLLPEVTKTNDIYQSLFDRITKQEANQTLKLLQWIHPQINKRNIQSLVAMPRAKRMEHIPTPLQMLHYIGIHSAREQQLLQNMLASITSNTTAFLKDIDHFIQTWERSIQVQAIHPSTNMLDREVYQRIQDSWMRAIPTEQWTHVEQKLMKQAIPVRVDELLQMMKDVKGIQEHTLEQLTLQKSNIEQIKESKQPSREFIRMVQHIIQNIGHSYEHSIAHGKTDHLVETLKGALMEFMLEHGAHGERARSLLQFIQGMQLQTVQETTHMLSVHLQIPAMIGSLRSDMHIEFESKKTSADTLDPNYCRILFDLDLAGLKRTFIDMHIQNQQVSLTIFNDFLYVEKIAKTFEPVLKEKLRNTGYEVTSIRYQSLQKQAKSQTSMMHSSEAKEGFDIKV